METPFLGLRTSIYRVSNISEATAWYTKVLGIQPYFNEPFYVGFSVGGYELGLQPEKDPGGPKKESVETYWGVEDVDTLFAHLVSCGATAQMQPTDVGEGIVVATVKDPWDNVFGIIKNPHFKL